MRTGSLATIIRIVAPSSKFGMRKPYSPVLPRPNCFDANSFPKEGFDCKGGDIVSIQSAGFHLVLMRMSLLERVGHDPFTIPVGSEIGEDAAFCQRAREVGHLAVGMGFPAAHIDARDGTAYIPGMPTMMVDGNSLRGVSTEHVGANRVKTSELRNYGAELDAQVERLEAKRLRMFERRSKSGDHCHRNPTHSRSCGRRR